MTFHQLIENTFDSILKKKVDTISQRGGIERLFQVKVADECDFVNLLFYRVR